MGKLINIKNILILLIIIGVGYLIKEFPDESILIIGIGAIALIGLWLHQAYRNESLRT